MTEAEWAGCTDPEAMLEHLRGKASDRKIRLFACACCRRFADHFADERARQAVALAERLADGGVAEEERARVIAPLLQNAGAPLWRQQWPGVQAGSLQDNFLAFLEQAAVGALHLRPWWASFIMGPPRGWEAVRVELRQVICSLLRDVIGNPFRRVRIDPAVLAWQGGAVLRAAQAVYDAGTFDDLTTLGEVLASAGCTDAAVLGHCKEVGGHARGCWVVDHILGRE